MFATTSRRTTTSWTSTAGSDRASVTPPTCASAVVSSASDAAAAAVVARTLSHLLFCKTFLRMLRRLLLWMCSRILRRRPLFKTRLLPPSKIRRSLQGNLNDDDYRFPHVHVLHFEIYVLYIHNNILYMVCDSVVN